MDEKIKKNNAGDGEHLDVLYRVDTILLIG